MNKERRWSTDNHELYAIYRAILFFHHLLEGQNFEVTTDHKPLVYAFQKSPRYESPRRIHHLETIRQYTIYIRHIVGSADIAADHRSRVEPVEAHNEHSHARNLAEEQARDPDFAEELRHFNLHYAHVPGMSAGLACDQQAGKLQPIVPKALRGGFSNQYTIWHIPALGQLSKWCNSGTCGQG